MKIRIELEIEARPYTADELQAEGLEDCEPDDDLDAFAIGDCLTSLFYPDSEAVQEAFGGSALFVKLGEATLIRAEQVEPS